MKEEQDLIKVPAIVYETGMESNRRIIFVLVVGWCITTLSLLAVIASIV